jgi:hypothetical protein
VPSCELERRSTGATKVVIVGRVSVDLPDNLFLVSSNTGIVEEHLDRGPELALRAPAPSASFYELQSFRKILLQAARAISMRSRFLDRLRSFALTDDLTGLYNRRGFLILGLQNLKLATRIGYSLLLFLQTLSSSSASMTLSGTSRATPFSSAAPKSSRARSGTQTLLRGLAAMNS